jgi:hypothetical protein
MAYAGYLGFRGNDWGYALGDCGYGAGQRGGQHAGMDLPASTLLSWIPMHVTVENPHGGRQ